VGKKTFDAGRFDAFRFDPSKLVIIGLDTDDGPEHPLWDERIKLPLDEAMVKSVMKIGVKETIIVRKRPDGGAEVVNGRRRTMHAREANRRLEELGEPLLAVPAVLERGDDDHHAEVMVSLNEIRVNDDVLVKAAKAKRMLDRCGDVERVATAFGVTDRTVHTWVKLDELPKTVKKAVSEGVLSANAAGKLHGMDKVEQDKALAELKEQHESTGKRASAKDASSKNPNTKPTPSRPKKKDIDKVVVALEQNAEDDDYAAGVIAGIEFMRSGKLTDDLGWIFEDEG
jgi:ParB family chromosome partitioning protein